MGDGKDLAKVSILHQTHQRLMTMQQEIDLVPTELQPGTPDTVQLFCVTLLLAESTPLSLTAQTWMDHPQVTTQYMENMEKNSTMMKLLSTILVPSAHNISYFAKNKIVKFSKSLLYYCNCRLHKLVAIHTTLQLCAVVFSPVLVVYWSYSSVS